MKSTQLKVGAFCATLLFCQVLPFPDVFGVDALAVMA